MANRENLRDDVEERLNELLKKDPKALNGEQRRYLKARSDYLTDGEKERFEKVLNEDVDFDREEQVESTESKDDGLEEGKNLEDASETRGTDEQDEETVDIPDNDKYQTWDRDELWAEVDRRNAEKEDGDKISKGGKNDAIAKRLEADDNN